MDVRQVGQNHLIGELAHSGVSTGNEQEHVRY